MDRGWYEYMLTNALLISEDVLMRDVSLAFCGPELLDQRTLKGRAALLMLSIFVACADGTSGRGHQGVSAELRAALDDRRHSCARHP